VKKNIFGKRGLAILLAMLMLLSLAALAACDSGTANPDNGSAQTNTDTTPENTDNGSTTPENTDNGNGEQAPPVDDHEPTIEELEAAMDWSQVTIGITCVSMSDGFVNAICGGMRDRFEALGASASIAEYYGDPTQDISNIENFITMGCDIIFDFCLTAEPMEGVTEQALAAGVKMVFGGSRPDFPFTAAIDTDHVRIGQLTSEMAIAWIDENFPDAGPDEIHAAAMVSTAIEALKNRSDAMVEALEADPRVTVTYIREGQLPDEGFTGTEEALTYDSSIRIVVCANDSLALGASNYIMTIAGADLSEYAVFGSGYTPETTEVTMSSAENASVLRGLIAYGSLDPSEAAFNCMYQAVIGNPEYQNSYVQWDEIFYVGPNDFEIPAE